MKRLLIVLALLVITTAAFGGVQDFGNFKIDVPQGWTATQDGTTVGIVKNDNSASLSITVDTTDGEPLKDIVEAFVQALNGTNIQQDENTFTFETINENGVESKCVISGEDDRFALIVMTGIDNAPEEIAAMVSSLQEK